MRTKNCNVVRRELDELLPSDNYSMTTADHLAVCSDCREFLDKQVKLQLIVGSLGTVKAPSDFDFRLRARLANEAANSNSLLSATYWSLARQGFVAIIALCLLLGTLIGVRRFTTDRSTHEVAKHTQSIPASNPQPAAKADKLEAKIQGASETSPQPLHVGLPSRKNPFGTNRVPKRSLVAEDFSSERAQRFVSQAPAELVGVPAFPIDAPGQALQLSLDDGRGNARTISFPTVSFGSPRVLAAGGTQLQPKAAW